MMKQPSSSKFAAHFSQSSAVMVAALFCISAGCGDGIMMLDSDLEVDTSVTANGNPSPTTSSANDDSENLASDQSDGAAETSATPANAQTESVPAENTDGSADSGEKSPSDSVDATDEPLAGTEAAPKKPQGTKLPEDFLESSELTPLNPQKTVLLDLAGKRILLKARVCLTEGLLEMLLCPHQTKEHESILATEAQAFTVHTGLLALGCKEGKAARYDSENEKYTPASGQIIDLFMHWVDTDGKLHRERAQNWVRRSRHHYYQENFETLPADLKLVPDGNLRYDDVNQYLFWYGPMTDAELAECLKMSSNKKFQAAIHRFHKEGQEKPMVADWVFVGSGFYEDGDAPKQYLAEGGYMICVANFPMAMLDVATPSDSNGTESLTYEAATERLPPRESEVMIELVPRPEKPATDDKDAAAPANALTVPEPVK
jgi:hypothetical protein